MISEERPALTPAHAFPGEGILGGVVWKYRAWGISRRVGQRVTLSLEALWLAHRTLALAGR
jgi:hypothetical protein